jgi:hypothetical protein
MVMLGNSIPLDNYIQQLLKYLSLPACAFIPLSIFYQKSVIKKWCPLCLLVLIAFALESVAMLPWPFSFANFSLSESLYYLVFMVITTITAAYTYLRLYKARQQYKLKYTDLAGMRENHELRELIINGGEKIGRLPFDYDLELGTVGAQHQMVLLVKPGCAYCQDIVNEAVELSYYFGNMLSLKVLPVTWSVDDVFLSTCFHQYVHFLSKTQATNARIVALKGLMNIEQNDTTALDHWISTYPGQSSKVPADDGSAALSYWMQQHEVQTVPLVILDGRKIGHGLTLQDVKKHLRKKLTENS